MLTEQITWIPVAERLPDSSRTVLVFVPAEYGADIGYFDGQRWRGYSSDLHSHLDGVTHWAAVPAGPAR